MSNKEMRSTRRSRDRAGQLSPDAESLVSAAIGLANSGSRFEDRYWECQLQRLIDRALDATHSSSINSALDRLSQTDGEGYGALVEAVESGAETVVLMRDADGKSVEGKAVDGKAVDGKSADARVESMAHHGLLVTAPLVVWTRFAIPAGALTEHAADALAERWRDLVIAPGVTFRMVPWLYSLDQLPREFPDMRRLARRLTQAAVQDGSPRIDFKNMPETAEMLADTRYLVGIVVTDDPLKPVFRWQIAGAGADHSSRVQCLERWTNEARPLIEPLLPGCGFECLLPDAYHINLRESDRRVRPYGIKAAVHFLTQTYDVEPLQIRATVGPFGEQRIDEYRIGMSIGEQDEVVRGVVWPLLGSELETDDPSPLDRIREALKEVGVQDVRVWSELNEPEFCEDCGAPLFPGPTDEIVHVEYPEDTEPVSTQFH